MCYFISVTPRSTDIELRFAAQFKNPESFHPIYSASAFSYPTIPIITNADPGSIHLFRWGLIPSWVKDRKTANTLRQRTLNARAETIFEKPLFRHSIMNKRCLIITGGFFEWRHEANKTYPYYITLKGHVLFALAGLWDTWSDPETGEILETFSIITTQANELLEVIHNTRKRMPVILSKGDEQQWLQNNTEEGIRSLLKAYNSQELEAYTVSRNLRKLGLNSTYPEILNESSYPELSSLKPLQQQ